MMPDSPESPNTPETTGHVNAAHARVQALQQSALKGGVTLRAPPPLPTSCCGRGCNGCVWEGYFSALDCWCEEAVQATLHIS
jgi:hypothetical protein